MVGAKAAATVDAGVFWMGHRSFHMYTGGNVQTIPCEVGDYVFSDINKDQITKVNAVVNSEWSEITWFYPSANSMENDRYVSFDYAENIWTTGTLDRVSGLDKGTFRYPMYFDASGILYEHEVGTSYAGVTPHAETGPISIGNGDNVMNVVELLPDEKTQGSVTAKFKTRLYPNASETTHGPFTMTNPTSVRFQGRQVRMRVEGAGSDWRVGIMRLDARTGGRR